MELCEWAFILNFTLNFRVTLGKKLKTTSTRDAGTGEGGRRRGGGKRGKGALFGL